jgi:DnaJ-domain-containing protein 1
MPPGFAPAFGLPIRFVPSDLPGTPFDPRAGAEGPSKGGVPKSAGIDRDMPGPLVRDLPPREPVAKAPAATKEPTAKTPQVAGSVTTAPSNTPKSEPAVRPAAKSTEPSAEAPVQAKPKVPEKAPEPAREVAAADPATSTGAITVVPKIINRPAGAEPSTTTQSVAAKPATPTTEKVPDPVLPKVAEVKPKIDAAPAAKPSIPFEVSPGPSALTAFAPSATTQALVGFAALVVLALGLFVWTRRREQLNLAAAGIREFGNVNFEGRPARPRGNARLSLPRPASQTAPRAPKATLSPEFGDGQVPRTREEACRVLGVSPDADEAAMKKVVQGLWQSWHPDLATSTSDRQLREQRTTQINVAWDILSGKQATA